MSPEGLFRFLIVCEEYDEKGTLQSHWALFSFLCLFVAGVTQLNSSFHNHHLDSVIIKNNTFWSGSWLLIGLWKET